MIGIKRFGVQVAAVVMLDSRRPAMVEHIGFDGISGFLPRHRALIIASRGASCACGRLRQHMTFSDRVLRLAHLPDALIRFRSAGGS
jgi:hypothetical protein